MKRSLLAVILLVPTIASGQSLGELAKKEKERREKNKREGKEVRVISEEDLSAMKAAEPVSVEDASSAVTEGPATRPRSVSRAGQERSVEEIGTLDESGEFPVPTSIPADAPLEQRIRMFELMKADYLRKVQEIDEGIAKNEARIAEIDAEIAQMGTVSGTGGAPVAPQQPTGDNANRLQTGQGAAPLVGEKNRLIALNQQMRQRKDQLKLDLQAKGRVAGLPAAYLRF